MAVLFSFLYKAIFYAFSLSMSSDNEPLSGEDASSQEHCGEEEPERDSYEPVPKKQRKDKKKVRGRTVTVPKRMKDFPGEFFAKVDAMWCIACQCPVDHRQITTARNHLKGAKHQKRRKELERQVTTPGPAAALMGPPVAPVFSSSSSGICISFLQRV